jgi:tRNA (cmo5U34)-methyltransferase
MSKKFKKQTLSLVEKTWRFNDEVASKFDAHVEQSIPHYSSFQKYIARISEWFLKDDCLVYDLACSTGETINQLLNLKISTKFSIIGMDNSKKMINLAKKKISKKIKNKNIKAKFILKDLNKIKLKKSNLILAILVFMFFNYKQRKTLLKKIYNSLESGGAFISVEKIRSSNSHYEDILNQMYFDFKLDQNLSEKEILNKAKSLRSSMYLFNEKESKKLLTEAGFKDSEVFFKCFNFVGYISIK